MIETTTL